MELNALIDHAIGFRQTASDLQETLNKLVQSKAPRDNIRIRGYFFSLVILRALSAEFFLKGLAAKALLNMPAPKNRDAGFHNPTKKELEQKFIVRTDRKGKSRMIEVE